MSFWNSERLSNFRARQANLLARASHAAVQSGELGNFRPNAAIAISVVALVVSMSGIYFQFLRVDHDFRAYILPLPDRSPESPLGSVDVAFMNLGNRSEAVVDVRIGCGWYESATSGFGCGTPDSPIEPVVVSPGEVVVRRFHKKLDLTYIREFMDLNPADPPSPGRFYLVAHFAALHPNGHVEHTWRTAARIQLATDDTKGGMSTGGARVVNLLNYEDSVAE